MVLRVTNSISIFTAVFTLFFNIPIITSHYSVLRHNCYFGSTYLFFQVTKAYIRPIHTNYLGKDICSLGRYLLSFMNCQSI